PQAQKTTPTATPMTLATTMSTTRQRSRPSPARAVEADDAVVACTVVPFRFEERGTGYEMRCPPCAGMTQIRFDGRRLRTFLSARLTGLPCSTPSIRATDCPDVTAGTLGGGQCFSARMTILSARPVAHTSGVATSN